MRIFLAPMEGVVDYHLRKLYAYVGGIDACVTEFIRVNEHVLPRKVFVSSCPELTEEMRVQRVRNEELELLPIRVQLLGSDPQLLAANAAKAAQLGAVGIDLNFGCPAKTVNKHRGGACLLDETELLYEIVATVRESVPQSTPVTAKIRLGYNDRSSYLENALAIEAAGATELFVHARSKADAYQPPAYWHFIADIRDQLNIPVIANGEIWNLNDYQKCRDESGCDDFMLGRGLLADPGLAAEIKAFEGFDVKARISWAGIAELLHEFLEETSRTYPKKFMGNRVKQWLHYLRRNYHEADKLFESIKREKNFELMSKAIRSSAIEF